MFKKIILLFNLLVFVNCCFAEEVKIGMLLTLTGSSADLGEDCKRGINLAYKTKTKDGILNEYKVTFVFGDSQGDPKTGISEFKRLVDQEKIFAALTVKSAIGMSINPISKARKIPLIGSVGHPNFTVNNEYAFRFRPSTQQEANALENKIKKQEYQSFAIVTTEDDWTLALTEDVRKILEKNSKTIVFNQTILPTEVDFLPLIAKIKKSKFDVLFANIAPISAIALFIKKAREQGIDSTIISNLWIADKEVIETAGIDNVEEVVFPEVKLKYPIFEKGLNEINLPIKRPSGLTFSCYSGVSFILETLENNKNIKDSESLYNAMLNTNKIHLLDNVVEVTDRSINSPVVLKRITKGEIVEEE